MSSETSWIRVQETIIDLIKNDQRLRNDVRGVFQYVPRDRTFPFIVIGEGVENQFDTFELEGKQLTLQISIWTADKGFKRAYEILDRVNEILDCQDLSFQDFSTVTVDFDRANAIRHVLNSTNQIASRYRLIVQEFVVTIVDVRGSIVAESDIEAVLNAIFALKADINAQSTLDGTLNAIFVLAGDITAQSNVDPTLITLAQMEGDINGDSTVNGDATILIALTSDVDAQSTIDSTLNAIFALNGDIEGQSTINATLNAIFALAADINAQSTVTGDLFVNIALTGDITAQSTIDATMNAIFSLEGDINGQSTVEGDLTLEGQEVTLSGDINAQSTVEGDLIVSHLAIHDGSRLATKTISSLGSTRLNADTSDLPNRHTVIVFNTSQEQIWVGFEDTVQVDEGIMIPSNDERSFIVDPNDPKDLWAIAENQDVNVIIAEIE